MDIIEVHRKDADTFEVGKIIFNNKKHLIVQEYSPYGEYDGYILNEKSQIKRIVTKSNYLNYIQSILSSNNDTIKFTSKEDMISYAIDNDKLLYVLLSSWMFFKILKPIQLKDNILYCYVLDNYGKILNEKHISIDKISFIEIDSIMLRKLEYYLKHKNQSNNKQLELVEIYIDKSNAFNVGEIIISNKDFLLAKSYDTCGIYNGYLYQNKNIITKISSRTNYLKFMKNIISIDETNYNFIDEYSIIDYAFKNKRFISIAYSKCKYCYDVKINDFDGKTIKYQIIIQTGKLDKEKSLDIKKINYVIIDSIELKILEKLLATKEVSKYPFV